MNTALCWGCVEWGFVLQRLGRTGMSAGHYCAGGLVIAVGLVNAGLRQRLGVWLGVD